jgi:hypothetical protein
VTTEAAGFEAVPEKIQEIGRTGRPAAGGPGSAAVIAARAAPFRGDLDVTDSLRGVSASVRSRSAGAV